jgi:endoglucanase
VIQRSGPGIPAATVSVPARYIHGPVSMINLDDFEKTIDLVETALRSFDEELIKPKG